MKSLRELSLNITEPEYRQYSALNYSLISTFQKVGFNMEKLTEREESASLSWGSLIDTMMTNSEEFDNLYCVMDTSLPEKLQGIVKSLYEQYKDRYSKLSDIDKDILNAGLIRLDFYPLQIKSAIKRIDKFFSYPVDEYYNKLSVIGNRTVVATVIYDRACEIVHALKNNGATHNFFMPTPFEGNIDREYQLKFAAVLNGVKYKCMFDELVVMHDKKLIIPVDLKTSCNCVEEEFYRNFMTYHYQLQARLYVRILKEVIKNDDYFKDFKVGNYRFIFSNKDTNNPMVWEYGDTHETGTLYYGRHRHIGMPDPEDLGKELSLYLSSGDPLVTPPAIASRNSIDNFLNTL